MATISLRVPDSIKKTMDSHEDVNWSAVLRNSINEKLEEIFLTKQVQKGLKDIKEGRFYTQKQVEEMLSNVK